MRASRNIYVLTLVALSMLVMTGCASVPAPQTARQSLAYTEATYTAVVQTLTNLRAQGLLSDAQQAQADTLIGQGNADLSAAHAALSHGDMASVQGRLGALDAVLVHLRTMLQQEASHGQ